MPLFVSIFLALALCLLNGLLNNQDAPAGILLTPLVLVAITLLINSHQHPRHLRSAASSTALLLCAFTMRASGFTEAETMRWKARAS